MATMGQDSRYRVLRPLGSGGMAEVTLAEDELLGRRVALKRLRVKDDAPNLKRLRREALIGASLNHPNLVSVYDVWEEREGDLCIVMEYIAGNTLRDLIRDGGSVPATKAIPILAGVAAALDAVHKQGIIHRDVKPANILLGVDGQIKLADLGIATVEDITKITTVDKVVGSFSYMAPEQLEGRDPAAAMDIYALAAVAYETLCGKKARPEPNPVALAHAIATRPPPDLKECLPTAPPAAAAVLQRGMAADPAQRPRSAGELIGRLRAAFTEVNTEPRPRRQPPRAVPIPAAAPPTASAPRPTFTPMRDHTHRTRPSLLLPLGALAAVVIAIAAVAALSSGGGGGATHQKTTHAAVRHHPKTKTATGSHSARTSTAAAASASSPASSTPAASPSSAAAATPSSTASPAGALNASTPSGAVQAFYEAAAGHDYARAWALADSNLRNQLGGYDSFRSQMSAVRSITFHQASTQSGAGSSSATVSLSTTSVQTSRTQNCSGTAQTVRGSGGGWLVDHLSISCV